MGGLLKSWTSALMVLSGICFCATRTSAGRETPAISCSDASDWTVCGKKMVCWEGACVKNKCTGSTCPAVTASKCMTCIKDIRPCIPSTGECQPGSTLLESKPDGSKCGGGDLVCWKGDCVQNLCGNKLCPIAVPAVCMRLAPGGTPGECNLATGQCEIGPFEAEADGASCGDGVCMNGQCVSYEEVSPNPAVDKCKDVLCPEVSPPVCQDLVGTADGRCDPATGQCTEPVFAPMPDGIACGWPGQTCQNGECV